MKPLKLALALLATLALYLPPALAQDAPPGLAEVWLITPKPGHGKEFFGAMQKHMAFRKEHGDPWAWQVYTPVLGDELSQVAIRYCCVNWADVDAYGDWSRRSEKVSAHFDEHVGPHVEKAEHYFESIDWENSHWPAGNREFRYYAVTDFALEAGETAGFHAAREKMSQIAIEHGWATDQRNWLWMSRVGGAPTVSVVIPHPNFASFESNRESFFAFLAEKLGSTEAAAELYQQFDGATLGSEFQIWERNDALSMEAAE